MGPPAWRLAHEPLAVYSLRTDYICKVISLVDKNQDAIPILVGGGGAQMLLLVPHTTVIKTNKQREQTETKTSAWGGLSLSLYFSLSMCSFKCDLCSINFHSSSFFPLIPTLSHSHKRIFLSNLPKMCNGKTIFFSIEGGRELILSIMQSRINFLNYFFSFCDFDVRFHALLI